MPLFMSMRVNIPDRLVIFMSMRVNIPDRLVINTHNPLKYS
jgi:hypothetical protein